ncbi:cystathionine beta-lyase [Kordiimonas sediminis]|uniref:cysteine-S-conjugate beta-lyase n=1 Tax=Kordiimonas sediminis TaxID=1735581 RepID=A0A919ALP3_9PROT|nr:MalY/PatB family protein [Kordiimonas sediminis]GHF14738.1 cystathionine beta-lyase [Kordiimonas sediminis]
MSYIFDKTPDRRGTHSFKWDTCDADVVPLWVADMDFPCPEPITIALQRRLAHPVYGYTAGSRDHTEAITGWLDRRFQWAVKPDWLVPAPPGAIHAIDSMITLFSEPGDEVILQTPGYQPLSDVVTKQGRKVIENPLDNKSGRFTLDSNHLESVISGRTRILILCSPHNPTGRVWTLGELEALLDICRRNDILVISDEVHADLIYNGYRHCPLGSLARAGDRVVTVISPSKSFNTSGIPQSTLVIQNDQVRSDVRAYMDRAQLNLDSIFGSVAMIAAYNECEDWLDDVMAYVQRNFATLETYLADNLPQLRVTRPEGTYLCWVDFRNIGKDQDELYGKMIRAGVRLSDGRDFGGEGVGYFRVNLACSEKTLLEGLKRLQAALNS